MYNLIRLFNQNRKKIIWIILIIVSIILLINLLNEISKNKNQTSNSINNNYNISNSIEELVSDKSVISGDTISGVKLQKDVDIIKEFIENCIEKNIEGAYNLLTDECREVMFSSVDEFEYLYHSSIFNNGKVLYTIENLTDDTYIVKFSEDILSTGNINNNKTLQDYITVVSENGEKKLNINSYIGRNYKNKTTEDNDIDVEVVSIDTYMDYEIYNLAITNKSSKNIIIDTNDDVNSIYLLDNNNMKYYFYNAEIIESRLLVKSKLTNNISIKFNNSYSSSRRITELVFSPFSLTTVI